MPEKEFIKAYRTLPRLKTKVNNFHRQQSSVNNSEDDYVAIRAEWTTIDRILACRFFFFERVVFLVNSDEDNFMLFNFLKYFKAICSVVIVL